jgi:GNAT superfamily N-acetyltransferase
VGLLPSALVAMGGVLVDARGVAELKRVRVLPGFQGRGLGRLLIQAIEARASALGAHSVFADTTVQQIGAQRLYEAAGYQFLETYEVDGFTALRFQKQIRASN